MDKNHIVNISAVTFYPEFFADEMIQFIQIDIAEKLACQVSDWKPFVFLGKKQAF